MVYFLPSPHPNTSRFKQCSAARQCKKFYPFPNAKPASCHAIVTFAIARPFASF